MSRNSLARPIIRAPITRRAGMPRGPGGVDEVILDATLGTGGVSGSTDPWGWPDDLYTYRVFDWRAGDGVNPLVGPTLAETGTPVASKSPFSGRIGPLPSTSFPDSPTSYYSATYCVGPSSAQDAIYVAVCNIDDTTRNNMILTYSGSRGVQLYLYAAGATLYWLLQGDSVVYVTAGTMQSAYSLYALVINRAAGKAYPYLQGVAGTAVTLPSGTLANSTTFYLGGSGASRLNGKIVRFQAFIGTGIGAQFTTAYAAYHAAAIFGLQPKSKTYYPVFTRTGSIMTPVGSDVFSVAGNIPRANPTQGLSTQPALTNKCYKNAGLVAADEAYITVSAGLTKTTQAVTLPTYGIYGVSLRVYEVANATGSDGYIRNGAVAANTNPRALSVRAHHVAGSGALLGLYCGAVWTCPTGTISDNYARSTDLVTPNNASQQWAIKIPDGCTLRFILMNNVESPVQVPEIPNLATAAAAAIGASSVNWGVALPNYKATVQAEIAPDGWDGNEDTAARLVLSDSISAGSHMVADAINQEIAITDGTNSAAQAITETDGSYQTVYTGWGPRGIVAEVAGTQDRGSYDGTIGVGNAITGALNRWLRRLRIVKAEKM